MGDDELLQRAAALKARIDELLPALDELRGELRAIVGELAEAGVPEDQIAAVTGIHPAKARRFGSAEDLVRCSFCGASRNDANQIVAGPGVYACDACVLGASLRTPTAEMCSFCGKGAREVGGIMVAHEGTAAMCDSCLALCLEIISDELGGSKH